VRLFCGGEGPAATERARIARAASNIREGTVVVDLEIERPAVAARVRNLAFQRFGD
jgi:hypothetical protein